jgi:hypothetical protein
VEHKFRETRRYKVAPINNNVVTSYVATKVLGCPAHTDRGTERLPEPLRLAHHHPSIKQRHLPVRLPHIAELMHAHVIAANVCGRPSE